jgi:PAS domain S-box-containing protein
MVEAMAPWPEEQKKARELWQRALNGEAYNITMEFGPSEQEKQIYDLQFNPLLDAKGNLIGAAHILRNVTEQVRLQEELQKTKELAEYETARLRAITDSMAAGLVIADADGNIIEMNPAGLTIHEFESLNDVLFSLQKYPELFEIRTEYGRIISLEEWPMAKALNGEVFTGYELWVTRKDTGSKWFGRYSGAPVRDGDGNIIMAVITLEDNTALKRAEESREKLTRKLDADRRRLETILHRLPAGVMLADSDGRVHYANEYALRLYGPHFSRKGADKYIEEWQPMHPDGRPFAHEEIPMVQALRGRETSAMEMRFPRSEGSGFIDVEVSGTPLFDDQGRVAEGLITIVDISDRKRIEKDLLASHKKLRTTINSITDGLLLLDRDWRYIDISETVAKIIGMRREDLIGKSVWELFPHAVKTKFYKEYHRAVETGQPVHFEEFYPEPLNQWLECHCYPSEEGLAVYFRDITERKAAEKALHVLASELEQRVQKRTAELERANRAKDEFLANMSHEIRTPMAGVLGLTEILLHQDLPEKVRDDLEMISGSADSVMTLINDLFDLSRISQGKFDFHPTEFDLRSLIRDAVGPFEFQARSKDLDFIVSMDERVPTQILCDRDRLGQVIKNLVSNAIKFTDQGFVKIAIKAEEQDADTLRLFVSVSDSGIGIPKSKQEDIFSAFTQLDPSYSKQFAGMGLGLAISKSLVEGMGGEVSVESTKGNGATFRFYVTCGIATEEPALTAPSIALSDLPPMTILLVEDNAVNRLFLRRALVTAGHKVGEAEDGKHALAKLGETPFDLVLMDIQMPEMDGVEATRLIRSGKYGRADIPIIALTAYAMKGDREKFLENGMDGYVTKPVDFGELARVIAEVCGVTDRPGN